MTSIFMPIIILMCELLSIATSEDIKVTDYHLCTKQRLFAAQVNQTHPIYLQKTKI